MKLSENPFEWQSEMWKHYEEYRAAIEAMDAKLHPEGHKPWYYPLSAEATMFRRYLANPLEVLEDGRLFVHAFHKPSAIAIDAIFALADD